jgi:hypothetical protein
LTLPSGLRGSLALMTSPGRTPFVARTQSLEGGIHAGFQMTSRASRSPM